MALELDDLREWIQLHGGGAAVALENESAVVAGDNQVVADETLAELTQLVAAADAAAASPSSEEGSSSTPKYFIDVTAERRARRVSPAPAPIIDSAAPPRRSVKGCSQREPASVRVLSLRSTGSQLCLGSRV